MDAATTEDGVAVMVLSCEAGARLPRRRLAPGWLVAGKESRDQSNSECVSRKTGPARPSDRSCPPGRRAGENDVHAAAGAVAIATIGGAGATGAETTTAGAPLSWRTSQQRAGALTGFVRPQCAEQQVTARSSRTARAGVA